MHHFQPIRILYKTDAASPGVLGILQKLIHEMRLIRIQLNDPLQGAAKHAVPILVAQYLTCNIHAVAPYLTVITPFAIKVVWMSAVAIFASISETRCW